MKGISDVSSALMEYEIYRAHSLQSQATTDTLSASESSFGSMEHACPDGVTSPGAATVVCVWGHMWMCVCDKKRERKKE